MIIFFTDLPIDVKLHLCFGNKKLFHEGKRYTYIGQSDEEPARYEVIDCPECNGIGWWQDGHTHWGPCKCNPKSKVFNEQGNNGVG